MAAGSKETIVSRGFLAVTVGLATLWLLLRRLNRKPALIDANGKRMPQMPMSEFLQRIWRMRGTTLDLRMRLEPYARYGELHATPTGISVCNPELVKQVIVQNWPKISMGGLNRSILFKYLLGKSLVAVDGEHWKTQKRLVAPAFHYEQLNRLYGTVFAPVAGRLVKSLNDHCARGSGVWDAQEAMSAVTIDVIGLGAFGVDFGAMEGKASESRTAMVDGLAMASHPALFAFPSLFKLPTQHNRLLERHFKTLWDLSSGILASKRGLEGAASSDLLDLILEGSRGETGLTDEELHHNVFLFFLAGHETSAGTLTMALHNLARSQEWQQRCRDEVLEVIGDRPAADISPESLQKLNVCTAVLKETLRMFPPAGGITPRQAPKGATLGGYSIPEGTTLQISIYAMHHHEKYWDRPTEFDPTRFMPGTTLPHPFAWMPFSAGPRVCIGSNFAWMEMRIVLAELLRNFDFALDPGYELQFERYITLRPRGMPLQVTRRQR